MIGSDWKSNIKLNAKNLIGWRTDRKIIVFSVDDYGNVRLDSKEARDNLDTNNITTKNRFDTYDTLETREDLEILFDVLSSVEDMNGRSAVFTPYAVPCNIDFERMREDGNQEYIYELLPQTFQKKSAADPENYADAWPLWNQGMDEQLWAPQFHGREHLNVKVLEEKLRQQDPELLVQLQNRSFTRISNSGYKTVSPLAAFDFWDIEENKRFTGIIEDGLNKFEKVFGYRAQNFTPPAYRAHRVLYNTLKENGIRFVDTAFIANQHQGKGRYKKQFNYTGKTDNGLCLMVRNVVFEPTDDRGVDWVAYTIKQIEAAFRWNRPAIISSHRVNFCGHIDANNREIGISALKKLLQQITARWPDVEFMSASELGKLVKPEQGRF
jgi:hypothetical protein